MLSNTIVLELASVLAGPSAGQFLAELGATVIKVENTGTKGDVTRTWKLGAEDKSSDMSSYFSCCNLGKKSIALNLKNEKALEIVHALAAKSTIVLANYKPGDAKKLQVDYQTLRELNPGVIYADINGYGHSDPRPGFDAVIQAEAGFANINGPPDAGPNKMPVALMDLLGAHQLKQAVLLSLLHKERTGEGSYVTVSLLAAGTSALANQATSYLQSGVVAKRMGSDHPSVVPYGTVFNTKDDKQLMLAVGNDKQFRNLCTLLGIPEAGEDPKFAKNPDRVTNREECKALLAPKFLEWNRAELMAALSEAVVPAGSINDMADVFTQPESRKLVVCHDGEQNPMKTPPVEAPGGGLGDGSACIRQAAFNFGEQSDAAAAKAFDAPPHYAQHTNELLQGVLGMSEAEVRALHEEGAVFCRE
jgi:crotonobetainyl-CoA:carnitine CoA-transferase CaiB-like acyl-CoA transferase